MTNSRRPERRGSQSRLTALVNCVLVGFSSMAWAQQPKQPVGPTAAAAPAGSVAPVVAVPQPAPAARPLVGPPPAKPAAPVASALPAPPAKAALAPPAAVPVAAAKGASAPAAALPAPAAVPPGTPTAATIGTVPATVAPVAVSAPAAASAVPAPAVAAAPFPPAKPAPELDQMKVLEGKWRCDGRAPAGPTGPEHAYRSTWKFKRDLDNFWWAAEYHQSKAKNHPQPMKARGYMTYDSAAKAFVLVGVDNMGGSSTQSTTGWSGDVVTLAGDASMAGKKVPYREVITKKGTREFTWRGEVKVGGDWVTLGEDRCKK